ncbi:hypothetical protein ACFO4O_01305 [Glaciecola siphonariae]|uniref:Pullulanase n=1 Tax=Glaciecola siphonariae TaxID=521012 RepID=A0ABV9LSZ8_9ALTE
MSKLHTLSLLTVVGLLGACSSSGNSQLFNSVPDKDYSDVYLRGVFNWWEATDAFKFRELDANTMVVELDLIADGQPYDFKVADSTWSPAFNCGLPASGPLMQLNNEVELYCFNDSLNLQFIPAETGKYRFELDISNNQYPELTVSVVQ